MAGWDDLTAGELQAIADALRAGRFQAPPSPLALGRLLGDVRAARIAADIEAWNAAPRTAATWLDLLAAERRRFEEAGAVVDLVWTGPESPGMLNRDTGSVMRELFVSARRTVFIAGYAVQGGNDVFRLLAERMDREPDLVVQMVVDIRRDAGDPAPAHDLVYRFAARFRNVEWPGKRLPPVYYDARSLDTDRAARASMHAKCAIIDGEVAFVTSANFTTAAQTKNIETGVLVRQREFASRLESHFHALVRSGLVAPLPLGAT